MVERVEPFTSTEMKAIALPVADQAGQTSSAVAAETLGS